MLPSAVKEEPEDEEEAIERRQVVEEVEEQFVDIETTPEEDELDARVKAEGRTPIMQRKQHSRRAGSAAPVPPPPYIEPEVCQ